MTEPYGVDLPDQQVDRIFEQQIVPREFAFCPPQQRPVVVIVVEQPGVHVDMAARAIKQQLDLRGGPAAEIDPKQLATYFPGEYAHDGRIGGQTSDPLAAAAADRAARQWTAQADQWCVARRVNAVIRVPATRPEEFLARAQTYRQAGYWVEARLPAVPEWRARLNDLNRYTQQIAAPGRPGPVTYTTKAEHAAATRGVTEMAKAVDTGRVVHGVHVADDLNRQSYTNRQQPDGRWLMRPTAQAAVETAHRQTVSAGDVVAFKGRVTAIAQQHPQLHGELSDLVATARAGARSAPGHTGPAPTAVTPAARTVVPQRAPSMGTDFSRG